MAGVREEMSYGVFVALCERNNHFWLVKHKEAGIVMATGAYVLDERIFNYEPVIIGNGEAGLPQTILKMAKDHEVAAVFMEKWMPINYPEDIKLAEKFLEKNKK